MTVELINADGGPFYAVPGNAGPRTMDYGALFEQGTYQDSGRLEGLRRHGRRCILDRPGRGL